MTAEEMLSVEIPKNLVERTRLKLSGIEFETPADCVVYALEQFLDAKESSTEQATSSQPFSKQDEEVLERKLKDLGYV